MEELATHDALTGLGNRRLFDLTLESEWRRALRGGKSMGLLLLDADCFKAYNDIYGHLAGDECLRAIASSIRATVKRSGDLAARYGGEEFVVLLPGATPGKRRYSRSAFGNQWSPCGSSIEATSDNVSPSLSAAVC